MGMKTTKCNIESEEIYIIQNDIYINNIILCQCLVISPILNIKYNINSRIAATHPMIKKLNIRLLFDSFENFLDSEDAHGPHSKSINANIATVPNPMILSINLIVFTPRDPTNDPPKDIIPHKQANIGLLSSSLIPRYIDHNINIINA